MNIRTQVKTHSHAFAATRIADNVLDLIGQTPMVRLPRYLDREDVNLVAKVEALNPGGSARTTARHMIERALADGRLKPGDTVVKSSSGNMGIGLAQACAVHGLQFICVVDPNAQSQNIAAIIRALGGQIELVDHAPDGDFLAARLDRVAQLLEENSPPFLAQPICKSRQSGVPQARHYRRDRRGAWRADRCTIRRLFQHRHGARVSRLSAPDGA
ncbi:pyridoxal-phosphate dependent enzyme [Sulfitobacter pontiacus]